VVLTPRPMAGALPALRRQRRVLLFVLLGLAAIGWAVVVWQAVGMNGHDDMDMRGIDLTMGMTAPLFLAMWLAMMVAMMFPASAPMILAFARVQERRRDQGQAVVPTWMFVAPYVAIWLAFGVCGYALAVTVDYAAADSMWATDNISRIAGVLLIGAGIYQLTPVKRVCLARCRSPLAFMLTYWRDRRWGAVSMGLRHGLFCLGCCWVLFLVLVPLGVMNIAAMLAVAALVFAEKALPGGERVAMAAAAILIAYGLLTVANPALLPTMT
jgi:predicted metal-binding membrane protein